MIIKLSAIHLFILTALVIAGNNTETPVIKTIKKNYSDIQSKLDSFTKDERQICSNPEMHWTCSYITVYMDQGRIVKLVNEAGEEGYSSKVEYYYKDDKLFFIFIEDRNGRTDPTEIKETRIYLDNYSVVQTLCRSGSSETISKIANQPCPKDNQELQDLINGCINSAEKHKEEYLNDVKKDKSK